MTRPLTLIVPALVLGMALPMAAQNVGRLMGKITNKEGQPLKDVKVVISRLDMNWSKTLTTDSKGNYSQAGMEPKEFKVTFTLEGFVTREEKIKVNLGDPTIKDFQMLKASEIAPGTPGAVVPTDESVKLEVEGLALFNDNLELYKQGRYAEAVGPFETAYQNLNTSLEKTTDEAAKADLQPKVELVERVLGLTYFQVGKKDQAEPLLVKAVGRKADDQNALIALVDIYKSKKDAANESKYKAMLEKLTGPNPDNSYNRGVEAFNAGHTKEARSHVEETLRIKADYADAYYLLALLELGDGRMAPARVALNKYLELSPNGKKAGEVKEILKGIPK
ncbi:MAG TPA: carboxypeptidase regulatory-like domain-containing protein [Holophagaceae bacterium]|nr:carboxypeptidase regulatory-like domain-containing protein [Holophagaceae bacterium]